MPKFFRIPLSILFVLIVAFTTFAFASSSTGTAPRGGEGAQAISGWTVSNVRYQLNGSGKLSAVEFDLDKPADVVKVSLSTSNPVYFDCVNLQGFIWTCNTDSRVEVSSMDEFRVVAVGN